MTQNRKALIRKQVQARQTLKKPPVRNEPDAVELDYSRKIVAQVSKAAKLSREIILPGYGEVEVVRADSLVTRLDDSLYDTIEELFRKLLAQFYGERLLPDQSPTQRNYSRMIELKVVKPTAKQINRFNFRNFKRETNKVIGVDPLKTEPWLRDIAEGWTRENVNLIKTIPQKFFDDLEGSVLRGVRTGASTKSIAEEITALTGSSKQRARVIARDQVGKLNATLEESRAVHNGITEYIWRTNDDSRVRPDHRRLDDSLQQWSKPPITVTSGKRSGERNHPGQDIMCRCYAENVYT